jgi:16S rRNA (cytosine967-C5)-methyltransferase
MTARELALEVLTRVEEDRAFAGLLLDHHLNRSGLSARDRRLATELTYGVLRWGSRLDAYLRRTSHRPLAGLPSWLRNLLRLGAYQCLFLDRIPPYAAVHESVTLAKARGHEGIALFVNAVLRAVIRHGKLLEEPQDPLEALAVRHSFPLWLVRRWVGRYGAEEAETLMTALNQRPPFTIRVNTLRLTREEMILHLKSEGAEASPTPYAPEGLILDTSLLPDSSPSFREGLWTVQDEASILVGHLLAPRPGERVLDLCAAPGGKTTHLAQLMENRGLIVGVDPHAGRLELAREACRRLGVEIVELVLGQAQTLSRHASFDRVLVDAPCSNLGILRRAPELKWSRQEEELPRLSATQVEILEAAAALVRPGGVIVYSTCSLEPEENEAVVTALLTRHPEFTPDPPEPDEPATPLTGESCVFRAFPHLHGTDGFTAFRLQHAEEPSRKAEASRARALPAQARGEVRPLGGVARLERRVRETRRGTEEGGEVPLRDLKGGLT